MRIKVKVVPRARQEKVEQLPDGSYKVWVRAVPEKGKANERVAELLAEHLGLSKSSVQLERGQASPRKVFAVPDL